jgi:cellobiose phosphorylase
LIDKPGGIFARQAAHLSPEDVILLKTAARVVLSDEHGSLAEQIKRRARSESSATPSPKGASFGGRMPSVAGNRKAKPDPSATELPKRDLIFFNGLGGFTRDGREYVITLRPGETTPAPWVNVIGNPGFGTLVSESGGAYTWSENCHEFRLTPWYNDAVTDLSGEAFYLRDEQSGQVWSPTPLPSPGHTPYVPRHGFGYSVFEHTEDGIASELWIYVSVTEPVKFALLKLRNHSRRTRRLSVTGYWEWVLGEMRHKNAPHVMTELDSSSGAILAQNHYNSDFDGRVAFVTSTVNAVSFTGSRTEFLGRNGTFAQPAALGPARLSGELGIGLDPCTALQVAIELAPAEERELAFVFGCGRDLAKSRDLVERFRNPDACREALQGVWGFWNHTLGAVYVETPEPALNVLANGWLLYQTLSCRLWARTGFYQSSGAFGFRDQLQDSLALVHSRPDLLREQLLRAAAHQFFQGDVLHWWHPPLERGVRTHFSDDYLWLPYAACHYVETIGDTGVLDEPVPLLEGREVRPEEEAYYDAFQPLPKAATLYEHCVLAIRHGLRFGGHGLPLIGGGDWNDGMNLIGHQGKGESVWLAFFLFDVLRRFARLAQQRGDHAFASECQQHAESLRANIEQHGWDGHWYRRAYFDHGEPLGSALNPECQIDALPQCWSVLSGAGDLLRSRRALDAVAQRLVRREARLIQLFDPPFDRSPLEPGYIKGYVPGVRENGGQYTHVAIWTVMAFALAGDTARAWELFTLINPVLRSQTAADVARYRVEPYVVAADIYSVPPHAGRGGWSWYTGSAGWMQRLMVETLLGVTLQVDRLRFTPRIPPAWQSFKIHYRYRETVYHVTLINEAGDWRGPQQITVDGQPQPEAAIPLTDDRREHQVEVIVSDLPPSR